ncbi:hypothetical protein AMTRI_Chr10g260 [Amborella trichopoda]
MLLISRLYLKPFLSHYLQFRGLSMTPDPTHLLRVCTILYQQRDSPNSKLFPLLNSSCDPKTLTLEFFIQVCNKFLFSWKPPFKFFRYTQSHPQIAFSHTPISWNKVLDILGKSKNLQLMWEFLEEMARNGMANTRSFEISVMAFASSREINKCIETFHLMNQHGVPYSLETMNRVVGCLCKLKLVEEAQTLIRKLDPWIKPDLITFRILLVGFCGVGNIIQASKIWNSMVDRGLEPDVETCDAIIDSLFKADKGVDALKLFKSMSFRGLDVRLSTYRVVINWLCKNGQIGEAQHVFEEMRHRGLEPDDSINGSLVFGLATRHKIREAYKMVESIKNPNLTVYHALIKALIGLKRPCEATQVFREMIERDCEPTMHTYIMLLQGHFGKRGRKGHNPGVNFDTVFLGGLAKEGRTWEFSKFIERMVYEGVEVPRFDYNKFLHAFSNEEGVKMFEEVGKTLKEVGMVDVGDVFLRYGEKMATRERRRRLRLEHT